MGRPRHSPTKAARDTVKMHAMVGTPQEQIAAVLGITDKTLTKYYRRELDTALIQANAQIGGALYNKAIGGDTTAQIFWMKTRAGWSEKQQLDHTSSDGSMTPKPALDVSKLSTAVLEELVNAQCSDDNA